MILGEASSRYLIRKITLMRECFLKSLSNTPLAYSIVLHLEGRHVPMGKLFDRDPVIEVHW